MKKILFIAAIATAVFASCTKIENDPLEADQAINFEVATQMTSTKAATAFDTQKHFGSYAYFADNQAGEGGNAKGTAYYTNEQVSYSSFWATDTRYYWPKVGTLTFLAYAPYGTFVPTVSSDVKKMTWTGVDFESNNVDLLYAKKAIQKSNKQSDMTNAAGTGYGVPTVFEHAAAQVYFKVVPAYTTHTVGEHTTTWEISLKSFEVSDVVNKGSFEISSDDINQDWNAKAWTPSTAAADKKNLVEYTKPDAAAMSAEGVEVMTGGKIVVPQTIDANTKVTVKVDIITKLDGVQVSKVTDYEFSGYLKNAKNGENAVTSWAIGTSYTYTIRIAPADSRDDQGNPSDKPADAVIKFDPTVNAWNEVSCILTI